MIVSNQLNAYALALKTELQNILNYWMEFTPDKVNGGFVGKIDHDNRVDLLAPKGSVLNARILWSFSAAYNLNPLDEYLDTADRAYRYIADHFLDHDYGGVYWTVDAEGTPLDTKKQVYAVAFTIYAFSEYFIATGNEVVKDHAIALYRDLIKYSFDAGRGGYLEAFDRIWAPMDDLRLSDKDANEKKTMNTHLHVLEAFTTLYRIWPDEDLKNKITGLLNDFTGHLIDVETSHLILFFDEQWNPKSNLVSYGHDIEASWLLLEAAEAIGDEALTEAIKEIAVKMAEASLAGIDTDGALWYEYNPSSAHIIKEKHWWVQAEAMVGFFNAAQLSDDRRFLEASMGSWQFVKNRILDVNHGEWFWGIGEDDRVMINEDKAGLWKCPYHNSRACMEIIKRIV